MKRRHPSVSLALRQEVYQTVFIDSQTTETAATLGVGTIGQVRPRCGDLN